MLANINKDGKNAILADTITNWCAHQPNLPSGLVYNTDQRVPDPLAEGFAHKPNLMNKYHQTVRDLKK
jgi:hypothetical protein